MLLNILKHCKEFYCEKYCFQPEKILSLNLESSSAVYELKNEYLNLHKNIIRHQDPILIVHIFDVY